MLLKTILAVLMMTLSCSVAQSAEAPGKHHVRFATVFTFLDAVFNSDKVWTRNDVAQEMRNARQLGVERLYWRVDAGGAFVYPTKVGTPYGWDGRDENSRQLVSSIESLGDPLRVFAQEAHKQGIEFFAWYPIRDRNGTSDRWNPKDPAEKERYEKAGRHPSISAFYEKNPQFNRERRQGDGSNVPTPEITAIRFRTANANASMTREDIQFWQSDDNLEYEPLPDTWTIERSADPNAKGEIVFTVHGLNVTKPWIKICKRHPDDWMFSGGGVDQWMTVVDAKGREWPPYVWMASSDNNPRFGEANYPYQAASRAKHVRNSVPWNALTRLRIDKSMNSVALFTPAMPPERYLFGYPCFAYPEVRAYEMQVIKELLTYPIDGIAISQRTHVRANVGEEYGFNPPVVAEYKKRYGVDILKEPFDAEKLRDIQGDNFTQMLREISQAVRKAGKKLIVMFEPDTELGLEWQPGQMSPWWPVGKMDWQWKKWAKEDLVDGLMVFTTGFNLPWDESLRAYLAKVRKNAAGREVSLFYDPDYNPRRQSKEAFLNIVKGAFADPDIDELNIFEYLDFWLPEQQLHSAVMSLGRGTPDKK